MNNLPSCHTSKRLPYHKQTLLTPIFALKTQLLYVTGRPTRDTLLRFFEGDSQKNPTAILRKPYGDLNGTYDLVCCSVRTLEDAPAVEPGMVGKGDDWSGGDDWLKMDLDEEGSVAYVDSSQGVQEMAAFLREVRE